MKLLLLPLLATCALAQVNIHYHLKTYNRNRKGMWEASAKYPVFADNSPLYKFANASLLKAAKKEVADFIKQSTGDLEGQPKPVQPYYFDNKPTISIATESLISLYSIESQDIGGAHPMYWYESHAFAVVGGKPKELRLKDLFDSSADPYKTVSDIAIDKLKTSGASMVTDGTVKSLNVKQLDQFCITPTGITILIPPYDVASYAEGAQEVKIKFSELQGLEKKGPLRGLLGG